ncbi:MAG: hypothetical protein H7242_02995 [Microbacteriaceae bacterium]|nr:hypothetical protein [Burkholderiaceae bacterium]
MDYVGFGGSGNWDNGANWSLPGVPGAGDLANITAGTATLSFDRLVGQLSMTNGTPTGAGLTITGTATLTGGTQTGTGTSQFNGNVSITGNASRTLSGGRIMATAGTTSWGGNTSDGGNGLNFSGSASIVNTGTWNDTNTFASAIASGNPGTKVFTNSGTYNKTGAGTSTVSASIHQCRPPARAGGRRLRGDPCELQHHMGL